MRRRRKNLKINQQLSSNLKQMTCPGPELNRPFLKFYIFYVCFW